MEWPMTVGLRQDQGPNHVKGAVGAALEEGVAHELVGRGLVEDGAVLVGDVPVVTVGADGVIDAVFAVAFEAGGKARRTMNLMGIVVGWPE